MHLLPNMGLPHTNYRSYGKGESANPTDKGNPPVPPLWLPPLSLSTGDQGESPGSGAHGSPPSSRSVPGGIVKWSGVSDP